MGRRRRVQYRFTEKGKCRWCGKVVKPPRRTWCSQECVDEYLIRSDPGFVRRKVLDRDGGTCAVCGLDCVAFVQALNEWVESVAGTPKDQRSWHRRWRWFIPKVMLKYLYDSGLHRFLYRSAWEADHILPVTEGGGRCGLDNYRTLCWRCHANETAALARRRADARRVGRGNILHDGMDQQQ